jgi:hypothetical protein
MLARPLGRLLSGKAESGLLRGPSPSISQGAGISQAPGPGTAPAIVIGVLRASPTMPVLFPRARGPQQSRIPSAPAGEIGGLPR